MGHQVVGNSELEDFSQHDHEVLDGCGTEIAFTQSLHEVADLGVGDGVNFLLGEGREQVVFVS